MTPNTTWWEEVPCARSNLSVPITFNYTTSPNCSWTAPPITELKFSSNCTLVAKWARTWLSNEDGVNDNAAADFFRQALPPDQRLVPSVGQLIDWYRAVAWGQKS